MATEQEVIGMYENELARAQNQNASNAAQYSAAMAYNDSKPNLIEWELDLKPDLVEIERLLRCDILVRDKDGNEIWVTNPDKEKVFLNDLGVGDILRKINMMVNKNKILSNYSLEEIRMRVRMIQHELRMLIYNNYELYGIDNDYKMNNYSMIVLTVGSMIEDTYRRAMSGEAHRSLGEQRLVTQNQSLAQQPQYKPTFQSNTGSKLNPLNWFKK